MKIAIVGAGNVGRALATAAVRAGHDVTIASRDPEDAAGVAREAGARPAATLRDAVTDAELVIPAVPAPAAPDVIKELGDAVRGKIIVDVTNRVRPDNPGAVLDATSSAEQIQSFAPTARVIKALNTIFAAQQANPVVDGIQLDCYVAGDDVEAKARVIELVRSLGFRPIDVGGLVMARALEAMAFLNIMLQIQNGWPWQTGWKLVGPTGVPASV